MRKTQNRRSGFFFTNGRVTAGFFKQVQEVPYYHSPTAYVNPAYNYPRTYGHAPPPVLPQGAYYGSPYHPQPALTYQPAPLIAYPNTSHYPPASTHPPTSTYLRVPQDQLGGSDRSLTYAGPSRSVASSPYINPNSIRDWTHSVHQSNNPSPSSARSNVQYVPLPSHRSEKRKDRDRSRDDKKSRRGSVYPPAYDYDHRTDDRKTDGGSRADRRPPRRAPQPNVIRREQTTQGPRSRRSCFFM